jgi:hypothetical protein
VKRLETLIDGMENLSFYYMTATEDQKREPGRYWLVDIATADLDVGYPGDCIGNAEGYRTRAEIVVAKAVEILRRLDGIA